MPSTLKTSSKPVHNEYLDLDVESDSEPHGYDSDEATAADSRTSRIGAHRAKRVKLAADDIHKKTEEEEDDDDDADADDVTHNEVTNENQPTADAPTQPFNNPKDHDTPSTTQPTPPPSKTPSKPGILYLPRIPPYMPPPKVLHHLHPFGPISNIFLTPEPPSQRHARLRAHPSANRKRTYIDGWVEFAHRRHAKACAAAINGNVVGGKKGGWFRDDVWSVRYLKGFRWGDLMEGVRREEREREERVRVGLRRDRKEREAFLRGVEGARVERGRGERRERRERRGKGGVEGGGGGGEGEGERRRFRQSDVKQVGGGGEQADEVKRVLSKIF